jgi:protein-S-isoprenylcysteine O-methyltransferase Ste14
MAKYLYFIILFFWGMTEIIFQYIYKRGGNKNLIDVTFYFVTIPFFLLSITPCFFILLKGYVPSVINITLFLSTFCMAIIIKIKSYIDLSNQFSDKVELKSNHKLIKIGIYTYIRHPLYLGSILMCLSCFLYFVSYITLILTTITYIGIFIRVHKEEKYLIKNLQGYKEYCISVKKFIPKIF